jgi:YD repeat-containing protein
MTSLTDAKGGIGIGSNIAADRISSLSQNLGDPTGSNLLDFDIVFSTQTFTAAYDSMGRITSFADNLGNSAAFTYDANGNRTGSTETRGSTTIDRIYTVNPQGNKLLGFTQQISGPAGTSSAAVNYTYNDNGDLTGDGLAQYNLNAEGRTPASPRQQSDARSGLTIRACSDIP